MKYATGEVVRILYESKRLTTGLSDVKIIIWDNTPTKVIDEQTLTELSDGLYYYDYTPTTEGNFIYFIDSASQPRRTNGLFNVGNYTINLSSTAEAQLVDAVWDEKLSDHQRAQTTGYRLKHITGGQIVRQRVIWSIDEKEKVIASVNELLKIFAETSQKSVNERKELVEKIVSKIAESSEKENELRDKILLRLADINTLEEIINCNPPHD